MAKRWYYNSSSGVVKEGDPVLDPGFALAIHSGLGWHGPFKQKQDALDYYNRNQSKNPGWKAPTDSNLAAAGNLATGTAQSAADAVSKGLGFDDNAIRSWLIRIGEILLGIVLAGIGVAKLTGTTNFVASAVKAKI